MLLFIFIFFSFTISVYSEFKIYSENNDIYFKNSNEVNGVIPYLVWFDMDSGESLSLVNKNWVKGVIPLTSKITCPVFSDKIATLPQKCPDNHSCFIGCVFVYDNSSYDVSTYPLSEQAFYKRLPGQNYFLTEESSNNGLYTLDTVKKDTNDGDSEATNQTEVEKPDCYKFDSGNKLFFYANTNAGLFEVVDMSRLDLLRVIDKYPLYGAPKEIYIINDFYILISENDNSTVINSFSLENNKLNLLDNVTLKGTFVESRRNNQIIYSVGSYGTKKTILNAIKIDNNGEIEILNTETFEDRADLVAIFNNYFVLGFKEYKYIGGIYNSSYGATGNDSVKIVERYTNNLYETLIIIPIENDTKPLDRKYKLEIEGYIPSDRHIYFKDNYLMFITSPDWSNLAKGSTFYVYKVDNSVNLVNKLENIAPGEQLYGTVFSYDKAYVVTFERKDPLWVIDISNPENTEIIGKLTIPGWSEKLFFNNDKLISVGYLNSLISIGLFDVSLPEKPKLVSRLTPLENQVKYSYSEAVKDERAFYINWKDNVSALPIETWYGNHYNFVQGIGVDNNSLIDLGISSIPFKINRTFWIGQDYVSAFSSRELSVLEEENGELKKISQIPLTLSADQIELFDSNIAVFSKYAYINRFYILNKETLGKIKEFSIDNSYSGVTTDKNNKEILFFNTNPLKFMLYKNNDFIKNDFEQEQKKLVNYLRYNPFIIDDKIILPVYYYNMKSPVLRKTVSTYGIQIFTLPDFKSSEIFTTPGKPVGVDINGHLISYEQGKENSSLRINILKISDLGVELIGSKEINNCNYFSSEVFVGKKKIYINCKKFNYGILKANENQKMIDTVDHSVINDNKSKNKIVIISSNKDLNTLKTFYPEKQLRIVKINEDSNLMLTLPENYYLYAYMPIWYKQECELYDFSSGFDLIKEFTDNDCYDNENIILLNSKILIGQHEKGLKEIIIKK